MMVARVYHKIWETCRCKQLADEIKERDSVELILKTDFEDYEHSHLMIIMQHTDLGVLDKIVDYGMKYTLIDEI